MPILSDDEVRELLDRVSKLESEVLAYRRELDGLKEQLGLQHETETEVHMSSQPAQDITPVEEANSLTRQFGYPLAAIPGDELLDPFQRLPAETRLGILMLIPSKLSVSSITRASPIMRQTYIAYKQDIVRNVLATDLDEILVQDAMAIILFPTGLQGSKESRTDAVFSHLDKWTYSKFLDPLEDHNPHLLGKLDRLHSLILIFIQDYITKATSPYPPRDYLCLPQIQPPSADGYLIFRGRDITPKFNTENLSALETKRFFRAFLRYELSCKAIKALPRSLEHWCEQIPTIRVHILSMEAMYCVHTYLCSLYGAVFAQTGDGWLPETPADSSPERELLFPDNFYADPDLYKAGLRYTLGDEILASDFAKHGFDLITKYIRLHMDDQGKAFREELEDFSYDEFPGRREEFWFPIVTFHDPAELEEEETEPGGNEWPMAYQICPEFSQWTEMEGLWGNIYRQRAWVFFDDNRLYPSTSIPGPHFPTEAFLLEQPDNSTSDRARRRSQACHDNRWSSPIVM
ncbi:hypothetical protein F53441_10101 [Fusarium austroafricanum]|uniref:Uncharacterized protein n=1 Tax=Fusarium austroafricanum TaxID=2364996 RepID=A0A8H4KA84_9HYPO|nr:hypothetical protein F53441_10101 [Fusarium austroafricanum]